MTMEFPKPSEIFSLGRTMWLQMTIAMANADAPMLIQRMPSKFGRLLELNIRIMQEKAATKNMSAYLRYFAWICLERRFGSTNSRMTMTGSGREWGASLELRTDATIFEITTPMMMRA